MRLEVAEPDLAQMQVDALPQISRAAAGMPFCNDLALKDLREQTKIKTVRDRKASLRIAGALDLALHTHTHMSALKGGLAPANCPETPKHFKIAKPN